MEKISSAQADILSEAIALWKEEELRKVRQNPSLYIQSGNAAISNGPITAISERVSDNRQDNHHESSADFVQNVPEESIISTSNEGISISEEPVNTSDVVSSNSEIVQNTNVDQSSNEEDEESSNVNNNQTITT